MSQLESIKGQVEYGANLGGLQQAIQALEQLSAATGELAKDMKGLDSSAGAADEALSEAGDGATDFGKSVVDSADNVRKLAEGMGHIKSAVSATFGQALGEFSNFEAKMAQVATLNSDIAAGFDESQQAVLGLSTSLGVDAADAADTFYQAISASVKGAEDQAGALKLVEAAGKAAVGGALDQTVAVDGITTALNAWGLTADDATKASDILFTAVAKGKTTFAELSASMFQAGPVAASMGVDLENVAGATATLTKSGTPTAVVMTQLKAAFTALSKPGADLQGVLQGMADSGQIAEATGAGLIEAYGDLPTALQAVRTAGEDAGMGLSTLFGSVEATQAVLGLTGEKFDTAVADLEAMQNAAGMTAVSYDVMAQTFQHQSNLLKSNVQAVFISIGQTLGTVLVPFMQKLNEVVASGLEVWNGMGDGTKRFLVTFAALAAIIGPAVMGFMQLQGVLTAAGAGAGMLSGAVKMLSASMLTNPVTAVILGITAATAALVTGIQGLNAEVGKQQQALAGTDAGLKEYGNAVQVAREESTGFFQGGVAGWSMLFNEVRKGMGDTTSDIRKSADAWLQYGQGVDANLLKTRTYKDAKSELDAQLKANTITLEQYQEGLIRAADAASQASGGARIFTESQQAQIAALAGHKDLLTTRNQAVAQALAGDEQWAAKQQEVSAALADGTLNMQQAVTELNSYAGARSAAIAADQQQAQAALAAAGAVNTYSDSFASLTGAGSQWTDDQAALSEKMAELHTTMSDGIAGELQTLWDARKTYSDNLAEAVAADAQAQADAQASVAEGAQAHADKMGELQTKLAGAGSAEQAAKVQQQIDKEAEKWATINALAEQGTGENVAKLRAAYDQQIAMTQEAISQMIVDHVNGQVLMGQTSEETAKQIFSTLRAAYPGTEVFSPVADAHAELMATISSATSGSTEAIAALPDAIGNIATTMEESHATAEATMDTWTDQYSLLGQAATESADVAMQANAGVAESTLQRSTDAGAALDAECGAHQQTATEASTAADTIRQQNTDCTTSIQDRATEHEASLTREAAAHGQNAAAVETATSTVRSQYTATADAAVAMGDDTVSSTTAAQGGVLAMEASVQGMANAVGGNMQRAAGEFTAGMSNVTSAVNTADGVYTSSADTVRNYGRAVQDASKTVDSAMSGSADQAQDTGSTTEDSMGTAGDSMLQAAEGAVQLAEGLKALPPEIPLELVMVGWEEAQAQVLKLGTFLQELPTELSIRLTASYNPKDKAVAESPSLWIYHWLEDAVQYADTHPLNVSGQYTAGDATMQSSDGSSLDWLKMYQEAVQWANSNPLILLARYGDDTDKMLRSKAGEAKLLLLQALEDLQRMASGMDLTIEDRTLDALKEAMKSGDMEATYKRSKEALDQLKEAEDRRSKARMDAWKEEQERLAKLDKQWKEANKGKDDPGEEPHKAEREALDELMDQERKRHEQAKIQLEDQADFIKSFYDEWKDYEGSLEDLMKEREKALKEAVQQLEDYYDSLEDQADEVHDAVMDMLDEEEDRRKAAHDRAVQQLEERMAKEEAAQDAVLQGYDDQVQALKAVQEEEDKVLREHARRVKRLELDLNLDQYRDRLSRVKDALQDIARSGTDEAKTRKAVDDPTKQLLQEAMDSGDITDDRLKRFAELLISGGELRQDYIRELLETLEGTADDKLSAGQERVEQAKREYEYAKLAADERKEDRDEAIDAIAAQKQAAQDAWKERLAQLEAEAKALDDKHARELEALDAMAAKEERRHKAQLEAIAAEAMLRKMLLEGKTEQEAKAELEASLRAAAKAREDARKLYDELMAELAARLAAAGQTVTLPPGSVPPGAVPGPVPPPAPGPILPPPGSVTTMGDGLGTGILPPGATLDSALGSGSGLTGGSTSVEVVNNFFAPVIVDSSDELQQLLRNTLGAFGTGP